MKNEAVMYQKGIPETTMSGKFYDLVGSVTASKDLIQHEDQPRFYLHVNPENSLYDRFRNLVEEWKQDTKYSSSIAAKTAHPAYQAIIGMGAPVLPILLSELSKNPDYWFVALRAISAASGHEVNPVLPSDRGNLKAMAQSWVDWGEADGYL